MSNYFHLLVKTPHWQQSFLYLYYSKAMRVTEQNI